MGFLRSIIVMILVAFSPTILLPHLNELNIVPILKLAS